MSTTITHAAVRPETAASAYRRAKAAGWKFIRRRRNPNHLYLPVRWFFYRERADIDGDGFPRREEAAAVALIYDTWRPEDAIVAAVEDDPRIVSIVHYPDGWMPLSYSGRDRFGPKLVLRRLLFW